MGNGNFTYSGTGYETRALGVLSGQMTLTIEPSMGSHARLLTLQVGTGTNAWTGKLRDASLSDQGTRDVYSWTSPPPPPLIDGEGVPVALLEVPAAPPGKPTALTVGTVTATTVALSWSAPDDDGGADVTGYVVEHAVKDSGVWTETAATGTSHTLENLDPSTTYDFRVSAVNSAGTGAPSDIVNATTPVGVSIVAEEGPVVPGAWDNADFTLTRTGDTAAALAVTVEVTESSNYVAEGTKTVTFAVNSATASLSVSMNPSSSTDGTITAAVQAGTGYGPGTPASATLQVLGLNPAMEIFIEDETATVNEGQSLAVEVVARAAAGAPRPGDDYEISVTLNTENITGEATSGTDFDALSTHVTFSASDFADESGRWTARKQVTVATTQDTDIEGDETFGLALRRSALLRSGIHIVDATPQDHTWETQFMDGQLVTITDDDVPKITNVAFTSDPGTDDTYILGDSVIATVTFDKAVDVTGTPGLAFGLTEATTLNASCADDTNVTAVECTLAVALPNQMSDGLSILADMRRVIPGVAAVKATGTQVDAIVTFDERAADSDHKVDSVPPQVESVGTSADYSKILLTMSEPMGATAPSGAGGFTVVNETDMDTPPTVSSVARDTMDNTRIVLTLSTALDASKEYTLDYAKPATDYLRDVPGNALAGFDSREVPVARVPGMPTGVGTFVTSATSVELRWTPPADPGTSAITGYDYRIRAGGTWGDWTEIDNSAALTSTEVTGLTAGTSYQLQVRARNDVGAGAASATAVVTTPTEFHACSAASATNRIWRANLTVGTGTVGVNTRYGWHSDGTWTGSALTDPDFGFAGEDYEFEGISGTGGSLGLAFTAAGAGDIATPATRGFLTFHAGGVDVPLSGMNLSNNSRGLWKPSSGVSWNAGAVVCLAMTIEPPTVESIELTSDPDASGPDDDTYAIGDTIIATVTFDQPVDWKYLNPSLQSRLTMSIGSRHPRAICDEAENATEVSCRLRVLGGLDETEDIDGVSIMANELDANGALIVATGTTVPANLAHGARADDPGHKVDSVRPTVESASTAGTALTLVWSEDLDTDTVPAGNGGFEVSVESGTAPAVTAVAIDAADPKKMTLTLSAAVAPGSNPTLAYVPPSADAVRDAPGNEAKAFTNQAVETIDVSGWTLSLSASEVDEDVGSVTLTVGLDQAASTDVRIVISANPTASAVSEVDWMFAVADNRDTSSITIPAGATSGSLVVEVIDDSVVEDDGENVTFTATFDGVQVGDAQTLTIDDDDSVTLALAASPDPVVEGGEITVTLSLLDGPDGERPKVAFPFHIRLDITDADNRLVDSSAKTLSFAALGRQVTTTLPTVDDTVGGAGGEVTLEMARTSSLHERILLHETTSATVRILDDDTPPTVVRSLTASPRASGEIRLTWQDPADGGGGQPVVKFQHRHAQASSVPSGTAWTDVPDSGEGGANRNGYTVGNLTNDQLHAFEVRAVNGAELEGPAAMQTATPLDAITVSFAHATQSDDEDGQVIVTVRLNNPPVGGTPVTVPIVARRGAGLKAGEYEDVPQSVTFSGTETSKGFTVNFIGDDDDERDETLTLAIGALPTGYIAVAPSETVLTLVDDDLPIVTATFDTDSATVTDEGGAVEVIVRLSEEPDREVVLPVMAQGTEGLEADEYTGVPESVTFGPRTTEVRFTVRFVEDTDIEPDSLLLLELPTTPTALPFRVEAGTPFQMRITLEDDDGPPAAPAGLTASAGHESVRLDWEAVANDTPVTRYELRWRESGGVSNAWRDVGLETTRRVDGLVNDRLYVFQVRAVNAHGLGAAATVNGTPEEHIYAIPAAPQNLGVTNEDSSRAVLSWTPPQNAWDPERSASQLQGYRIEVCRASCDSDAGWHALVANTGSIATGWVHGVLAPGVIRENRYRVRAINLNGTHGAWSNEARLGATVVSDGIVVRSLDPGTIEVRFTVEHNPDGRYLYLRTRPEGSSGGWRHRDFELTRKGEYEWKPGGLTPSPFDGAPTVYRVELDFSPDFDTAWKKTKWEQMPLEGTGSTVTPPRPRPDEPVRVEIDVNRDGHPDRNVRLSLEMGKTKKYRLRLADGCTRGAYQVRAEVVRYKGVGTRGGYPALMRYKDGRDWAVLRCNGSYPYRPWTEIELHAPAFAEHAVAAHERADVLLDGEWPVAWRHQLYKSNTATPDLASRLAEWQAPIDATVTLPRDLRAPSGVTFGAVAGRADALKVDWQPVAGAVGYELRWRQGHDLRDVELVRFPASADRPVTLYFDGAVTRDFVAAVRAWSDDDASPWSASMVRPGSAPALSVADTQAFEENGKAGFAVTLSEPVSWQVKVDYATVALTARVHEDYSFTQGTLTFAPYETEKTVWVPLIDDAIEDSGETFTLVLDNARGGDVTIADDVGIGTILNREGNAAPTGLPTITGTARVGEELTASVDGIEDDDGMVNAAFSYRWLSNDGNADTDIEDADEAAYRPSAADVGRTLKVRVTFTDDGGTEETVVSAATAPVAAALPEIAVRAVSEYVAEGGAAVFALSRTGDVSAALTVSVAVTAEGAALESAAPAGAVFASGARTVEVSLATVDDETPGSDGAVTLAVAAGTGYAVAADNGSATVTVLEDDAAPAPPPAGEVVLWSATMTVSDNIGGSVGGNHAGAFTGVSAPGGFRVRSMSYTASTATLRIRMTGTLPKADGLTLHAGDRTLTGPRMKVVSKRFGALVTFRVDDLGWKTGDEVAVRFVQRPADAAASDAALASLGLGDAALAPAFEVGTLVYAASVDAGAESVTVTAAARDGDAEVAFEPADADTGTDGHQVALAVGETLVTARVTAADGETVRAYRVVVTRAEAEAETGPVAAALSVGGAAAEPGRFQVRAAFGDAVTGFALDDLSALRVGGDAAAVSDLVEAETGEVWTAWVTAADAGRYVVRLGAGAAQAGARESAAAVLVADVDTQGNAAAVAGPAVAAVTVVAPAAGSWTAGDDIEVTLRFTGAVTVDTAGGTPTVGLTVGGNARSAAYASGSGTGTLTFAYAVVADDGAVRAVEVTENSLALAGGTIRDGAESDADLAHPGAELTLSAPQVVAPTAAFSGLPQAHDGETAFSLSLAFSEEVAADAATLQGGNGEPGALTVAGGTVERLVQVEPGSSRHWTLRIEPDGEDTVTVTLAAIADCAAGNAVCTGDGRALAGAVSGAVPGPSATVPPATDALTAAFREMPATHGGPGSEAFTFQVLFSESIKVSYRVLGGPDAFDVTGGSVSRSWRVDGRDELRGVAVQPAGWDDVTVTLAPTASCDEDGAICTADGRRLSGTETATVRGPVAIDVADATVTEGPGVTLDFVVTLSRASSETVTVDYATADGTAKAGDDYTKTEGTLTFAAGVTERTVAVPVLDDAVDDGGETMKLLLSDAEGARIRDGEAIGTIENSDAIPQAWLARFGRTVADHVVDAVGSRLTGPAERGSHVTLGGRRIALDGSGAPTGSDENAERALAEREATQGLASIAERMAGASDDGAPGANAWTLREEDGLAGSTETMSERELLLGSSFHLALGAGGEGAAAGDTAFTAWGRAASSRFDGEADGLRLDGEVTTFTLGADAAWSRWLAGVAVSVSEGEGSYRDHADTDHESRGSGALESTLTGVHPYARLEVSERLSLWGVLGFGSGELTLEMDGKDGRDGERFTTDTGQEMAAVGARGVLVAAPETGGLELALRTDAVVQRMTSDAATSPEGGKLAAAEAQTSRLRLMLEGSHAIAVGEAGRLVPTLEVGLRQDGGDAETGTGVEVGGGLAWTDPATGLAVAAKLRGLVAHEDADYSEWGASGSVRIAPGADGRGLSLTLAPAWGAAEGGAARLWSHRDARAFAPENETQAGSRLEAELGYGFSVLGGRAVATPWAGLTRSESGGTLRLGQRLKRGPSEWRVESAFGDDGRRHSAGWGYRLGSALDLTLEAMRREVANDNAPAHAIELRLRVRW